MAARAASAACVAAASAAATALVASPLRASAHMPIAADAADEPTGVQSTQRRFSTVTGTRVDGRADGVDVPVAWRPRRLSRGLGDERSFDRAVCWAKTTAAPLFRSVLMVCLARGVEDVGALVVSGWALGRARSRRAGVPSCPAVDSSATAAGPSKLPLLAAASLADARPWLLLMYSRTDGPVSACSSRAMYASKRSLASAATSRMRGDASGLAVPICP